MFDLLNFLKLSVHVFCLAEKSNFVEQIAKQLPAEQNNYMPGVRVVGTPNADTANTILVGRSDHIWLLGDKPGTRAHLSFELNEPGT
jgi:hypothetical protein